MSTDTTSLRRTCTVAAAAAMVLLAWLGSCQPASAQYDALVRDPENTTNLHVESWQELRRRNIVMQQRDFSCGAAALATILQYYWRDHVTELDVLRGLDRILTYRQALDRIENGLTLTDMRRVSVELGYMGTIGRLDYDQLTESKIPLLVGIIVDGYDHFVVFRGTDGEYVYLADPARGNIRVRVGVFLDQWQRNLALVVIKPGHGPQAHSPLMVTADEQAVGHVTEQHIRARVLPPPRFFPSVIR